MNQFLNQAKNYSSEVHTSCLTFLLDTVENTDYAWRLRRGAQRVLQPLLMRSKDCRAIFARDHIRHYIAVISEGRGQRDNHSAELVHLQEDVSAMLLHLSVKFARFYPRFSVACRWLEDHRIGTITTSHATATATAVVVGFSVAQLRLGRDAALLRGETECRIVRKLVAKAELCFEVLVPRIEGVDYDYACGDNKCSAYYVSGSTTATLTLSGGLDNNNGTRSISTIGSASKKGGEEEVEDGSGGDDDSSIEWEDGDNDTAADLCCPKTSLSTLDTKKENISTAAISFAADDDLLQANIVAEHEMAVERTLQAMGVQRPLEINVAICDGISLNSGGGPINGSFNGNGDQKDAACRVELKQCINLLSRKHYPRLQLWVEALSAADNISVNPSSSRVVSMSCDESQRRGFILVMLMQVKRSIARTLSRAAKLGVTEVNEDVRQSDQREGNKGDHESKKRARITWSKVTGSAVAQNVRKTREQKLILAVRAKRKQNSRRGLKIKI